MKIDTCGFAYLERISGSNIFTLSGILPIFEKESDSEPMVIQKGDSDFEVNTQVVTSCKLYADMIPIIIVSTDATTAEDDGETKTIHNILTFRFDENDGKNKSYAIPDNKKINDIEIFWFSKLNDALQYHQILDYGIGHVNLRIDDETTPDNYRRHCARKHRCQNKHLWYLTVETGSMKHPIAFGCSDTNDICFNLLQAIYDCFDTVYPETVKIEIRNQRPRCDDKIVIGIVPSKFNDSYENLIYYAYEDHGGNDNADAEICDDLHRIMRDLSKILSFMEVDESIRDLLENWDAAILFTKKMRRIDMNSQYGLLTTDEPVLKDSRPKKSEILKDKFDKMFDDASRKAGLIDAPVDPTTPINISDNEVDDLMSKLNIGGNKNE